jgi:hypothetical protein
MLSQEVYRDFGLALASEYPANRHGIQVVETRQVTS